MLKALLTLLTLLSLSAFADTNGLLGSSKTSCTEGLTGENSQKYFDAAKTFNQMNSSYNHSLSITNNLLNIATSFVPGGATSSIVSTGVGATITSSATSTVLGGSFESHIKTINDIQSFVESKPNPKAAKRVVDFLQTLPPEKLEDAMKDPSKFMADCEEYVASKSATDDKKGLIDYDFEERYLNDLVDKYSPKKNDDTVYNNISSTINSDCIVKTPFGEQLEDCDFFGEQISNKEIKNLMNTFIKPEFAKKDGSVTVDDPKYCTQCSEENFAMAASLGVNGLSDVAGKNNEDKMQLKSEIGELIQEKVTDVRDGWFKFNSLTKVPNIKIAKKAWKKGIPQAIEEKVIDKLASDELNQQLIKSTNALEQLHNMRAILPPEKREELGDTISCFNRDLIEDSIEKHCGKKKDSKNKKKKAFTRMEKAFGHLLGDDFSVGLFGIGGGYNKAFDKLNDMTKNRKNNLCEMNRDDYIRTRNLRNSENGVEQMANSFLNMAFEKDTLDIVDPRGERHKTASERFEETKRKYDNVFNRDFNYNPCPEKNNYEVVNFNKNNGINFKQNRDSFNGFSTINKRTNNLFGFQDNSLNNNSYDRCKKWEVEDHLYNKFVERKVQPHEYIAGSIVARVMEDKDLKDLFTNPKLTTEQKQNNPHYSKFKNLVDSGEIPVKSKDGKALQDYEIKARVESLATNIIQQVAEVNPLYYSVFHDWSEIDKANKEFNGGEYFTNKYLKVGNENSEDKYNHMIDHFKRMEKENCTLGSNSFIEQIGKYSCADSTDQKLFGELKYKKAIQDLKDENNKTKDMSDYEKMLVDIAIGSVACKHAVQKSIDYDFMDKYENFDDEVDFLAQSDFIANNREKLGLEDKKSSIDKFKKFLDDPLSCQDKVSSLDYSCRILKDKHACKDLIKESEDAVEHLDVIVDAQDDEVEQNEQRKEEVVSKRDAINHNIALNGFGSSADRIKFNPPPVAYTGSSNGYTNIRYTSLGGFWNDRSNDIQSTGPEQETTYLNDVGTNKTSNVSDEVSRDLPNERRAPLGADNLGIQTIRQNQDITSKVLTNTPDIKTNISDNEVTNEDNLKKISSNHTQLHKEDTNYGNRSGNNNSNNDFDQTKYSTSYTSNNGNSTTTFQTRVFNDENKTVTIPKEIQEDNNKRKHYESEIEGYQEKISSLESNQAKYIKSLEDRIASFESAGKEKEAEKLKAEKSKKEIELEKMLKSLKDEVTMLKNDTTSNSELLEEEAPKTSSFKSTKVNPLAGVTTGGAGEVSNKNRNPSGRKSSLTSGSFSSGAGSNKNLTQIKPPKKISVVSTPKLSIPDTMFNGSGGSTQTNNDIKAYINLIETKKENISSFDRRQLLYINREEVINDLGVKEEVSFVYFQGGREKVPLDSLDVDVKNQIIQLDKKLDKDVKLQEEVVVQRLDVLKEKLKLAVETSKLLGQSNQ